MYVTEVICGKCLYLLRIIPVIFGLLLIKSLLYFLLPPLRDDYTSLVAFILGARKADLRNEMWEERVRKLERSIKFLEDQQKSFEANATSVNAKTPDTVTENTNELYAKYTNLARQFEVYRCRIDDWEKSHNSSYNALSNEIADIKANTTKIEKDLSTKIDKNQSNSTKVEESLSNKIDDIKDYTTKIEVHLSTKIDKIPSHHETVGKPPSVGNLSKRIEEIQNQTSEIEEKLTRSSEAEESLSRKINQIQSDNDKLTKLQGESESAIQDLKVELLQTQITSGKNLQDQYKELSEKFSENLCDIAQSINGPLVQRIDQHAMALRAIPKLETNITELQLQNDDKRVQLDYFAKLFKELKEFCEGTVVGLSKVPKDIVGQFWEEKYRTKFLHGEWKAEEKAKE
ncbi:MAG: hypothetical protein Q9212_007094 [Teloschistes hypoglaucus]